MQVTKNWQGCFRPNSSRTIVSSRTQTQRLSGADFKINLLKKTSEPKFHSKIELLELNSIFELNARLSAQLCKINRGDVAMLLSNLFELLRIKMSKNHCIQILTSKLEGTNTNYSVTFVCKSPKIGKVAFDQILPEQSFPVGHKRKEFLLQISK